MPKDATNVHVIVLSADDERGCNTGRSVGVFVAGWQLFNSPKIELVSTQLQIRDTPSWFTYSTCSPALAHRTLFDGVSSKMQYGYTAPLTSWPEIVEIRLLDESHL